MASASTRQRLIESALELFLSQGISSTPTRQIANLAGVNEVTLFRHFGNKYGLLLAVLEEAPPFANLEATLQSSLSVTDDLLEGLRTYADQHLRLLEEHPDLVRSLIGEADQYPPENRRALGQRLTEANRCAARYFEGILQQAQLTLPITPERTASLMHALLLGYAVIEFTSEDHNLWAGRAEFVVLLEQLFLQATVSPSMTATGSDQGLAISRETPPILDLPAALVHGIIQAARKSDLQDYAIAYLLFGAGLTAAEAVQLQRSHHISDSHQQLLVVVAPQRRQVPVNQWIMGKRYGSYTSNPLTKWLKSRKDDQGAMFLDADGAALSKADLQRRWRSWTENLVTPSGQPASILQAYQTWCVEMLMRGMSLENLSILTRQPLEQLQPFAERAREKAALEQAAQLDHKPQ